MAPHSARKSDRHSALDSVEAQAQSTRLALIRAQIETAWGDRVILPELCLLAGIGSRTLARSRRVSPKTWTALERLATELQKLRDQLPRSLRGVKLAAVGAGILRDTGLSVPETLRQAERYLQRLAPFV